MFGKDFDTCMALDKMGWDIWVQIPDYTLLHWSWTPLVGTVGIRSLDLIGISWRGVGSAKTNVNDYENLVLTLGFLGVFLHSPSLAFSGE